MHDGTSCLVSGDSVSCLVSFFFFFWKFDVGDAKVVIEAYTDFDGVVDGVFRGKNGPARAELIFESDEVGRVESWFFGCMGGGLRR